MPTDHDPKSCQIVWRDSEGDEQETIVENVTAMRPLETTVAFYSGDDIVFEVPVRQHIQSRMLD